MKKLRSLARIGIYITILGILGGLMAFLGAYLYAWPQLPDVSTLKDVRLQTPLRVYTYDHALVAEFGEKRRIPVSINQIPNRLSQALIATEDQRFYSHGGVDFLGMARVALKLISSGRIQGGGSTITMQLARNFFLTFDRTFRRKIKEIFLSWKIEHAFDKAHILELYWNKINFGQRAYGVGAAAQVYYGTTVDKLTLPQLATIAGIPKGPSTHNPISNPIKALKRRNHVLKRMLDEDFISHTEYVQAINAPQTARLHGAKIEVHAPYVAEMVRRKVISRFGLDMAYNDGLSVYTTLLAKDQHLARQSLRRGLIAYDRRHGYRGAEQTLTPQVMTDPEALSTALADVAEFGGLMPAIVLQVGDQKAELLVKHKIAGRWQQTPITLNWADMNWARPFNPHGKWTAPPKVASDILHPGDQVRLEQITAEHWTLAQLPDANAAFVAVDANTGAIRALEGGFDFDLSKFNRVTQARRQPGSNIKPFIYSAALEKGFTAASIINDSPITFIDRSDETVWRPKNDSGKFKGPTRLRQALRLSTNLVSVRLLEAISTPFAVNYLTRFGLPRKYLPAVRSLALGTASITPLELVGGYATFANGGFRVTPYIIDHIEDVKGNYLQQSLPKTACLSCAAQLEKAQASLQASSDAKIAPHPPLQACPIYPVPRAQWAPRVIGARNDFISVSLMRDVIRRGTAWRTLNRTHSPLLQRTDVGGKTGTTNDARDAWFSGFTGHIAATAWVGFDDSNRSLGAHEFGGVAALPIWQAYMEAISKNHREHPLPQPPGIVTARIDTVTGKLARIGQKKAMFEIFRAENVPTEYAPQEPAQNPFSEKKSTTTPANKDRDDGSIF